MRNQYKIYPKEFKNEIIPIQTGKCFVIMPFDSKYDIVYGEIKKYLTDHHFQCNRADDISGSSIIMSKIIFEILNSQFVIADLTGQNPNVFYELGIAHSFKDASNVIIIEQDNTKCPFDLSHLFHINYDPSNLKLLTAKIVEHISDIKYISDFYEILNVKGIVNYISDNADEFVHYIVETFDKDISVITEIINGNTNFNDNQLETLLNKFEVVLTNLYANRNMQIYTGVMKVYFEVIFATAFSKITENHIKQFICGLNENDQISLVIDLMIRLADNNKIFKHSMEWIVNYFDKTKATTIDLNKYKLERFLMLSDDVKVNEIIIDSLYSEKRLIRERMANIIGEKKLTQGKDALYSQLHNEENNFNIRSIIHAISKINPPDGLEIIEKWVDENNEKIINNKDFFMFHHIYTAMSRMDNTDNKIHIKQFENKFGKYIN